MANKTGVHVDHLDEDLDPVTTANRGCHHQQAQTSEVVTCSCILAASSDSNSDLVGKDSATVDQMVNISSTDPEDDCSRAPSPTTSTGAESCRIAEIKHRRGEQSQLFRSLSTLVPGLTKFDKASILDEAAEYLKTLQARVNMLEEDRQTSQISTESHHEQHIENDDTSNDVKNENAIDETISTRVSGRNLLITICCKKNDKLITRIPTEIRKLHLIVQDFRVMPFGGIYFHITVVAEMGDGFYSTMNEIVDYVKSILMDRE